MKSQLIPVLLNIAAGVLGALGQYAYKKGGLQLGVVPLFKNHNLLIGIALFCVVMVLFVFGYKLGGRISVVYPFYATTFIWAALIGYFWDGEAMNMGIITGTVLIILGLAVIAQSVGESA